MSITSRLQKLTIAIAGVAASLVAIQAQPARSANVTYDFTVDVTSSKFGLAGNQYSGFFSFDSQLVRSTTYPDIYYAPITDFNFNFAGTTYTLSDLLFELGPLEPSDIVFHTQTPPLPFPDVNLEILFKPPYPSGSDCCINLFDNTFFVGGGSPPIQDASGSVTYSLRQPTTSVPEPNGVLGLTLLCANSLLLRKKWQGMNPDATSVQEKS